MIASVKICYFKCNNLNHNNNYNCNKYNNLQLTLTTVNDSENELSHKQKQSITPAQNSKSEKMNNPTLTLSSTSGRVCTGIGCHWRFGFHCCSPDGGYKPARLQYADIRQRFTLDDSTRISTVQTHQLSNNYIHTYN